MPDGVMSVHDEEKAEFTIMVACESYCSPDIVLDALARLSDFNGYLDWGLPSIPDPHNLVDDMDLVLIITDKASLPRAMDRSVRYKHLEQPHILVYLRNEEEDAQAEEIPGLIVLRPQLAMELSSLAQALLLPAISQGLVCIDWMDTRHVLLLGGRILLVTASGDQVKTAIKEAVTKLRKQTAGRHVLGLQGSILCNSGKLATRDPLDLLSACREITGEEATLVVSAPFLNWPDIDHCEVRVIAKIECTGTSSQRDLPATRRTPSRPEMPECSMALTASFATPCGTCPVATCLLAESQWRT